MSCRQTLHLSSSRSLKTRVMQINMGKHLRFNMGDGKFGAAYAQEDGVAFKEESTGNNERIGEWDIDNNHEDDV